MEKEINKIEKGDIIKLNTSRNLNNFDGNELIIKYGIVMDLIGSLVCIAAYSEKGELLIGHYQGTTLPERIDINIKNVTLFLKGYKSDGFVKNY